jgi:hypothetical protein
LTSFTSPTTGLLNNHEKKDILSFGFIMPAEARSNPDRRLDIVFCNAKDITKPPTVPPIRAPSRLIPK